MSPASPLFKLKPPHPTPGPRSRARRRAAWFPGARPDAAAATSDPGRPWAALLGALPDFSLAFLFLSTWLHPLARRELMVRDLTALMLLEFVVMHSSMLMFFSVLSDEPKRTKVAILLGGSAVYALFAAAFAASFHSWWPFLSFWMLTANRLASVLLGAAPDSRQRALTRQTWVVSVAAYLFGTAVTASVVVPALGVTPEVIARQHFSGGGLWIDEPYRCLAFGALYFGVQGLSGVADFLMLRHWQKTGAPRDIGV